MEASTMRSVVIGAAGALLAGVGIAFALRSDPPAPVAALPVAAPAAPTAAAPPQGILPGLCEASAIVRVGEGYLVGDNETEDRLHGFTLSFAAAVARPLHTPVEDVEALAMVDGAVLIVGSQSANKSGKPKPDRERVELDGHPPIRPDLAGCAACEAARGLPPKEGGLAVEGAAWWGGSLWLGVRSPLDGGKALLLRMEGTPTTALRVAEEVRLDLGGFGVRDLTVHDGALLVLAGPLRGGSETHRLYRLVSPSTPPTLLPGDLPAGSEGIVVDGGELVVVTDGDGQPDSGCVEPARWYRLPLPTGAP